MSTIFAVDGEGPVKLSVFDLISQTAEKLAMRYAATKDTVEMLNINTAIGLLSIGAAAKDEITADKMLSAAKRVSRRQIIQVK